MKTIMLRVGDRLKALVDNPFDAWIEQGEILEIISFDGGNDQRIGQRGCCPVLQTEEGQVWYTNMKELFHNYKKETK